MDTLQAGLRSLIERKTGGALVSMQLIGDGGGDDGTAKGTGYGRPMRIEVAMPDGSNRTYVFHTASANPFGHDLRADRAAEMLIAYDSFEAIPDHVEALDVGAIGADGELISLAETGELYLITRYAGGAVYAEDLRRIALSGATERDRARMSTLASYLVELHREPLDSVDLYHRSLRDLVGSGEGVFGLIDNFPDGVDGAPRARLAAIESGCNEWRWKLRDRVGRLRRIHGDFHPFNIVFDDDDTLALLDASRGCFGDPANDVACLAINYPFFALDHPGAWTNGLRELWYGLWSEYLEGSGDTEMHEVVAPYLAWRGLVLANPLWYPDLAAADRDAVLGLVELALAEPSFHPEMVERIFERGVK